MTDEDDEKEKPDVCDIAWDVAMEVAADTCGGADKTVKALGDLLGIEMENPIADNCRIVLETGLTKERCQDFRGIRQWVMCRSWQLMDKDHMRFRDAIRASWQEAKTQCAKIGAVI